MTAPPPIRRVLVVDFSEDGATDLAGVLRIRGHAVTTALDPVQAMSALAGPDEFDVVLVDFGPIGDGCELTRAARRLPGRARLRFVALSGQGLPEDRATSTAAGFETHVVRPLPIEQVFRLVETTG